MRRPEPEAPPAPLLTLRDGLPEVVETDERLLEACAALAAATGPVAIDAERASGYRYSNRAYLIQLRREGAGTWLIDPIPLDHPGSAAGGPGRHRVDPARGDPGPAVPARDRPRARPRSSTASSPAGCWAIRASAWRPSSRPCSASACARSTPPPTGPPGRCPSRGWTTPRSTSRSSSSCATDWSPSSRRPARPSGPARSSTTCSTSSPPCGTTPGGVRPASTACAGAARWLRPGPVGGARRDRGPARRHPRADHPRRRHRGRGHRTAGRPARPAEHPGLPRPRRRAATPATWVDALQRSCAMSEDDLPTRSPRGDGPPHPRMWADRDPVADRRFKAGREADAHARRGSTTCRWRTCSPPTTCAARCGSRRRPASRPTWPTAVRAQLAAYGARPWQVDLVSGALLGAVLAGDVEPQPSRARARG